MATRPRHLSRRTMIALLVGVLLLQGALTFMIWMAARNGQTGWFFGALVFWGLLTLEAHEYRQWLWPAGLIRSWLDRRRTSA
jgi:hypothetical protein